MTSNTKSISTALKNIFSESTDSIIIGFTGRTGSGCSTCAKILIEPKLSLPAPAQSHYSGNELRKFRILKKYIDKHWRPFKWLHITSIITDYILKLNFKEFVSFISNALEKDENEITTQLSAIESSYTHVHLKIIKIHEIILNTNINIIRRDKIRVLLYFKILPKLSKLLKENINKIEIGSYTKIYQQAGDNIRASGRANSTEFNPDLIFSFAERIDQIITSARSAALVNNEPCRVVIDAIRNPYEAIFFRRKYSEFYLISVNTDNENRLAHLRRSHKISEFQIQDLDKKEYPDSLSGHHRYISQNIQKCIEIADIHINNPRTNLFGNNELRCQLAWYITLMLHPGLVMPTSIESCMQIAYSVKKNSGCISRQVGAIVTDSGFSVKAVGWNNTAQGQVPCILRSAEDLLNGFDENAYSHYEKNDIKFREALEGKFKVFLRSDLLDGRNLSFCFKDLQNQVDDEKNQVHTRSLHAEENAFLQISKHGGQALKGGILFTTASPCELCAKKAYQLGISQVIYIDPYPGIATSHILSGGDNAPALSLFRGAVGSAFDKLYQPIMPYKDELNLLLALPKHESKVSTELRDLKSENEELKRIIAKQNEEIARLKISQ